MSKFQANNYTDKSRPMTIHSNFQQKQNPNRETQNPNRETINPKGINFLT